jgi:integrase
MLRDLARSGMLFTPSGRLVADEEIIGAEHARRIQAGAWPGLHRDPPGRYPGTSRLLTGPGCRPPAGSGTSRWQLFRRYSGGKTLHELRHSRLIHLGEANVSAPLLMAISGHKRLAAVQRYVQPSQAAVAALMAASDPDRRGR